MTGYATAVVESSTYTAVPVTFSLDPLFDDTHFALGFPDLTLNTLPASAKVTIVQVFFETC
jgi:hypothetical protein